MRLTFYGAAREVTGSCYLVETGQARFLVDCGMFQGGRETRAKNIDALDFDLASLDFVLVTHAHIDHSGLLPRLVTFGFRGPIYATTATTDLLVVMLRDSAHIQEKEAEWENYTRRQSKRKFKHEIAPLYTVAQADACLKRFRSVDYAQRFQPHPSVSCRFQDAGHILGSAILEIWAVSNHRTRKLVFSGDLGQPGHPVVEDPTPIAAADILLVESTYGDRTHKSMADTREELVHAVNDTLRRKGGNLVIPAFTVGRTQDLIFLLYDLTREGRLHDLDIYVDSPMAAKASEITLKHRALWDREAQTLLQWQNQQIPPPIRLHFVEDVEESMALNTVRHGALIISASGMCDAGRIKHHLRYNLGRRECTILITGFQAAGTLGRRLVDGAKTVRIFKQEIPVRADIYTIGGLSAHADREGLLNWLSHFRHPPRHTFIVHGEETNAQRFAGTVRERLGWDRVTVPDYRSSITLDSR